jgi:hypothetical protein
MFSAAAADWSASTDRDVAGVSVEHTALDIELVLPGLLPHLPPASLLLVANVEPLDSLFHRVDRDTVAVFHQRDGPADPSLRRDVTDDEAMGGTGETSCVLVSDTLSKWEVDLPSVISAVLLPRPAPMIAPVGPDGGLTRSFETPRFAELTEQL